MANPVRSTLSAGRLKLSPSGGIITPAMENATTIKTDAQILEEHSSERTKCTVYTRVMGYHRPVETFNAGKQGEFYERAHFDEPTLK